MSDTNILIKKVGISIILTNILWSTILFNNSNPPIICNVNYFGFQYKFNLSPSLVFPFSLLIVNELFHIKNA
jgi:hypothetical protein